MAAYPTASIRTKNWSTEVLTDADLEAQLDLIHTWLNAAMNSSTGHKHDGTTSEGPKISLTSGVSGTLPLGNGGTGQTTLAGLLDLVYPVGSVYTNASVSTNPNTLLGFGTWVAIEGECIVGLVAGGIFDTLGTVSEGEETHTLTTDEMPDHTHTSFVSGSTWGDGAGGPFSVSGNTGSTGGDVAHNNIQPSYVCYIWRRTA